MNLKLYSIKNDLLELSIEPVRPNIKIVEIHLEDGWHPWHCEWQKLKISNFDEDFETVKNKIIEYYKAETASCTLDCGAVTRKPGMAKLTADYEECTEEWQLENCKIVDCDIDDDNKKISIELWYDGARYEQHEKVDFSKATC